MVTKTRNETQAERTTAINKANDRTSAIAKAVANLAKSKVKLASSLSASATIPMFINEDELERLIKELAKHGKSPARQERIYFNGMFMLGANANTTPVSAEQVSDLYCEGHDARKPVLDLPEQWTWASGKFYVQNPMTIIEHKEYGSTWLGTMDRIVGENKKLNIKGINLGRFNILSATPFTA